MILPLHSFQSCSVISFFHLSYKVVIFISRVLFFTSSCIFSKHVGDVLFYEKLTFLSHQVFYLQTYQKFRGATRSIPNVFKTIWKMPCGVAFCAIFYPRTICFCTQFLQNLNERRLEPRLFRDNASGRGVSGKAFGAPGSINFPK